MTSKKPNVNRTYAHSQHRSCPSVLPCYILRFNSKIHSDHTILLIAIDDGFLKINRLAISTRKRWSLSILWSFCPSYATENLARPFVLRLRAKKNQIQRTDYVNDFRDVIRRLHGVESKYVESVL